MDKPNKEVDILEIIMMLQDFGLKNVYHELRGESFGNETKKTYFHHFKDYDDMVNRDWKKICDNSKIWTEIKHEISRQ